MLGFFDLEFKMDDINKHEPPLQKLDKVINWEIFRPILVTVKICPFPHKYTVLPKVVENSN